jgi:hypothetical protein
VWDHDPTRAALELADALDAAPADADADAGAS